MISMNSVTIQGRLGRKAKMFNLASNKPYCQFPIGINKKSRSGEVKCEWIACEAWGDLATIIDRMNIAVGQEVLISGYLRNRDANNGKELCVVAMDFKIFPVVPKMKGEENVQQG